MSRHQRANNAFSGRNFILKSGSSFANTRKISHTGNTNQQVEEYSNYKRENRLDALIIPAASPSSPEIVFHERKLREDGASSNSTSTINFPNVDTITRESDLGCTPPKSREEIMTPLCVTTTSGLSSTIGDITPSLFEAIYNEMTPSCTRNSCANFGSSKKVDPSHHLPNSSPELSIGSLPSDIMSSPEYAGSSPPILFGSHRISNSSSFSSPTTSPRKKKMKPNERMFDGVDFNLVSQESKCVEKTVGNFDIQSHSRVFALEFKLNDLSCEIEEIVCIELLKNGGDFQETGIRFHAPIVQKADQDVSGKYYLTDALTNLSRLIYSNSLFNVDQSPKIVTRSHGKKMDMLLETVQNIIISDTFDTYSFLNSLHHLISEQTIYLYESFKDNIKPLCNEQEILSHFSISNNSSKWVCQLCSIQFSTVCSLVECCTTSLLFQKMFPIIDKKKSSQQQFNDSVISINIDYDEALSAIKTPPNETPKKMKYSPESKSSKKIAKIKISPKSIVSASHSKDLKKTLQLTVRNSPKKTRTSIVSLKEKENVNEQSNECHKVQFVPPPRINQSTSPKTCLTSSKLTILKKKPSVEWTDPKVEELLLPKSVAVLHYFCTCKQKNLDSFFKSPKSTMIIQMRPFLSVKDLVKKFSDHPCLGLTNLVQFCKTTFGVV